MNLEQFFRMTSLSPIFEALITSLHSHHNTGENFCLSSEWAGPLFRWETRFLLTDLDRVWILLPDAASLTPQQQEFLLLVPPISFTLSTWYVQSISFLFSAGGVSVSLSIMFHSPLRFLCDITMKIFVSAGSHLHLSSFSCVPASRLPLPPRRDKDICFTRVLLSL